MILSVEPLFTCVSHDWGPGIGDPDFDGWLGVALYGLAALMAVLLIRRDRFPGNWRLRSRVLWGLVAMLMAFLALNKQLDLQTLLIAGGRCVARANGWYEDRRLLQRDFIIALAVWIVLSGWLMIWLLRGAVHRNRLLLSGLGVVLAFVLVRAMHFFHVLEPENILLDYGVHVLTTALEFLGPVLILAAGYRARRGDEPAGPA